VITTLPKLYDEKEIAEWLRVSKSTLRRMVKRGEIKAKQIGRRWKFTDAMVQNYLSGPEDTCKDETSSADSGSPSEQVERPILSPGLISGPARLDARRRAQQILSQRSEH
jgi:excisionase family DNA binding protein